MKAKYFCEFCDQDFDTVKECAAHEKRCERSLEDVLTFVAQLDPEAVSTCCLKCPFIGDKSLECEHCVRTIMHTVRKYLEGGKKK